MIMTILDGKSLSKQIKTELKAKVADLVVKSGIKPGLAIVEVGSDPASEIYVRNKIKSANFVGIEARLIKKDESITQEELLKLIDELNADVSVHGIIVQLPLPKHLDERAVIDRIDPDKDIDGFGVLNKGKLFSGMKCFQPATPLGVMKLLDAYNIPLKGKEAVVVGRSNIVGKPMGMMLLLRDATVTIAHRYTVDLKKITKEADILVVAVGKKNLITADMIKPGAVVVDVGINREGDKIYGDVDFDNVSQVASHITPVPGGVGPLTIAALLANTVEAYENKIQGIVL
ncbi:MAG TPA: bifunctional methylenetetrahydrofolate dehydrogenase/methenyltetrahydrofolate cyclohydrolase FolD [Bacilli bacterium]|nr:bifunctional methylenetetrahydrofolate dehydrogenase/methenyltetrahydrofolate cyclohydrolase FolD [Acholeplasmataceae bacterium]HOE77022.1 bifunctional methylenetetrahydrofolate dehydrogenase/methenyltetrahydrofolate cyclohydrolase FolD [Bacilli bacterium]HOR95512.1 bifunctional methylenetetrahydrofolate dehydrogenase/methenyltetrahydrofolate cyclohydrolase FolD [Bacilli bacterium]HPK58542.1 bifunctional methylenetetrahydrofolate dehydrogenase/methenyltetrahydrofolate cyclohydrolase FolD [Bac